MNFLNCLVTRCAYNRDWHCGKESVSVEWKTTRDFEDGERVSFLVCADYKEIEDDGTN